MARIIKDNLKKPEDVQEYEIWHVGSYNTETGDIVPLQPHKRLNLGFQEDIEETSEKTNSRLNRENQKMKEGDNAW